MALPRLADLRGRTALVTGASGGIGQEIARGLAAMGARLILACRDRARGEAAREEIAASTANRDLDLRLVDFSQPGSVRTFAEGVLADTPALHILVNNAGGWSSSRRVTAEGFELTWATNVLGYFLTTELLLPRLIAGAPARIVNVASQLAYGLDLSDVGFERRPYDGLKAYAQSKQVDRMWTWALARRLQGTGVTANALHPGSVATGIFSKGGGLLGALANACSRVVGRSPEKGADTALWLAASPEVEGRSGGFFLDRRELTCRFHDRAQEERLWRLCEEMTRASGGAG